jgi:hypothetical protein
VLWRLKLRTPTPHHSWNGVAQFPGKDQLAKAIFEHLEIFHNRQRRHSALGMLTPLEFENTSTWHEQSSHAAPRNQGHSNQPTDPGQLHYRAYCGRVSSTRSLRLVVTLRGRRRATMAGSCRRRVVVVVVVGWGRRGGWR